MRFVTIDMIAKHTGRRRNTVTEALRKAGVSLERTPGVKGFRIPEKDANRFILKQWPAAGPLPLPLV